MKAFTIDRYKSKDGGRIVDIRSRRSGTTTYSSRSTRPASISSMQRSHTENSKSSCRTDFHLFSATTSPAPWSR